MHLTKRILALLLCMVLVLGVFPVAASAQEFEKEEVPMDQPRNYGLINQYHYGTTAVTDAYLRGESLTVNGLNLSQPVRDLPSKYDSRITTSPLSRTRTPTAPAGPMQRWPVLRAT